MRKIIFILFCLISVFVSAQQVNKYGQKVVSEIYYEDFIYSTTVSKTFKFYYNINNELQNYDIIENLDNIIKTLHITIKDGKINVLPKNNVNTEYIYTIDENHLINSATMISKGSNGYAIKTVEEYIYDDVYLNGMPYLIKEYYKEFVKEKNKTFYKEVINNSLTWYVNYYNGIKLSFLNDKNFNGQTENDFQDIKDECYTNIEYPNTNIDFSTILGEGLEGSGLYLNITEWQPQREKYIKKCYLKYIEFVYDNDNNLIKIIKHGNFNDKNKITEQYTIKYKY